MGVGKIADMVLLNANPLKNIHNTRQIEPGFVNGRLLSKDVLQQMLLKMRPEANKK